MLVYVSWNSRTIITEEDFRDRVTRDFDRGEYNDYFRDYLENHYSAIELFELRDDEKDDIREDFRADFIDYTIEHGNDEFDPYEI